jgi:hypothetical protein
VGAIGFVADTYLSDIPATTAAFRRLLDPARIEEHGHVDLALARPQKLGPSGKPIRILP